MVKLELLNKKDFKEVYFIMEESFPSDEYRSFPKQKNLLNNQKYKIYVLKDNDKIIVFLAMYDFVSFIYIEHLAVSSFYRNHHYGSLMLQQIKDLYHKEIVLEVEVPNDDITKRRIAFYQKNGFIYHDYCYLQPPMEEGKNFVELKIMMTKNISLEEFNCIKNVLYSEVYHYKY